MARGHLCSVCFPRVGWRSFPSRFAALVLAACTPRVAAWPEDKPAPVAPLCYNRVPATAPDLARRLEAAWARSPETHFTASDLSRLWPASGPGQGPDSSLFKITEHHYQNQNTYWRLKTANGQVLYTVTVRNTSSTESALCARPLKWLARPLDQAALTAPEWMLARQWMALDLARLLPLLPLPQDPPSKATAK